MTRVSSGTPLGKVSCFNNDPTVRARELNRPVIHHCVSWNDRPAKPGMRHLYQHLVRFHARHALKLYRS